MILNYITIISTWKSWEWILKDKDTRIRKLFIELKLKKSEKDFCLYKWKSNANQFFIIFSGIERLK